MPGPENNAVDASMPASREATVWLATYALGIRNTPYNIEPIPALCEDRWRFEVEGTEVTCSLDSHVKVFPTVGIEIAHQVGDYLADGSRITLGQTYRFINSSIKKPKYTCYVSSPNVRQNGRFVEARSFFDGRHDHVWRGRREDKKEFERIVGFDEKPTLTVGKWHELQHYLHEAIDLKRASTSPHKK